MTLGDARTPLREVGLTCPRVACLELNALDAVRCCRCGSWLGVKPGRYTPKGSEPDLCLQTPGFLPCLLPLGHDGPHDSKSEQVAAEAEKRLKHWSRDQWRDRNSPRVTTANPAASDEQSSGSNTLKEGA